MQKQLVEMLQASLSGDNTVRKQAEAFILEAKRQPGFLPTLLEVSSIPNDQTGVAVAAAV